MVEVPGRQPRGLDQAVRDVHPEPVDPLVQPEPQDRAELVVDVGVVPDGRVVVVDRENDRLQVFSADGDLLDVWGGFKQPLDIWGDGEGNLFVTDLVPSLSMLSRDGKTVGRCRPVLNGAHGIWGDADGHLFLAEPNPSRVTRLVPV